MKNLNIIIQNKQTKEIKLVCNTGTRTITFTNGVKVFNQKRNNFKEMLKKHTNDCNIFQVEEMKRNEYYNINTRTIETIF